MKNWKKVILIMVLGLNFVFLPGVLLAQGSGNTLKGDITGNLKKTGTGANYNTAQEGEAALASIIGAAIKIILGLLGTILLGLLIYGGYLWMIARGNDSEVTKAKDIIQQAIIGMIIIMTAYIIADFVVDKLTEAVGVGTAATTTIVK
jgi:uncharacterized iron-regulated membrane protein